jgi:hypothetical protein
MPNHVIHRLYIHGDNQQEVKSFIRGEAAIDFNRIIPMPEDLNDTPAPTPMKTEEDIKKHHELMQKYGVSNWYDWRLSNWNTKWNAYNIEETEHYIQFQTAWSTPLAVIEKLSLLFPENTFEVSFADEDLGYNCGSYMYQNGERISEEQGDMAWACELWEYELES